MNVEDYISQLLLAKASIFTHSIKNEKIKSPCTVRI